MRRLHQLNCYCFFDENNSYNLYWHFSIYFHLRMKIHNESPVLWGKKSGFVDSGFGKTCDELVTYLQKKFKVF